MNKFKIITGADGTHYIGKLTAGRMTIGYSPVKDLAGKPVGFSSNYAARQYIQALERPTKSIGHYEQIKCATLRKYGCPEKYWWLAEVITTESFAAYYGPDTLADLDPDGHPFCVFYHENGDVCSFAGFSNDPEFEEACRYVAAYLAPAGD